MVTTTATVNERWVGEGEVEVSGAAFDGEQDMPRADDANAQEAKAMTPPGASGHRRRTVTQSQLLIA
jgi:hypothetical protein